MPKLDIQQIVDKLVQDEDFNTLYEALRNEAYNLKNTFTCGNGVTDYFELSVNLVSKSLTAKDMTTFIVEAIYGGTVIDPIETAIKVVNQFMLILYIASVIWSQIDSSSIQYKNNKIVFANNHNAPNVPVNHLTYWPTSHSCYVKLTVKPLATDDYVSIMFNINVSDIENNSKYLKDIEIEFLSENTGVHFVNYYSLDDFGKKDIQDAFERLYR